MELENRLLRNIKKEKLILICIISKQDEEKNHRLEAAILTHSTTNTSIWVIYFSLTDQIKRGQFHICFYGMINVMF